jgi:hypothetical protein
MDIESINYSKVEHKDMRSNSSRFAFKTINKIRINNNHSLEKKNRSLHHSVVCSEDIKSLVQIKSI